MSLNVQTAISQIVPALQTACGLDDNFEPLRDTEGNILPPPSTNTFPDDFSSAYDDYGSAGEVPGTINEGGDISALVSALADSSNSPSVVDGLASALASYWATVALIPGEPAFGGVAVVDVQNDASTKTSDFKNAIQNSVTNVPTSTPYSTFLQNVESVVKNITWLVTESQTTGNPITHETSIS